MSNIQTNADEQPHVDLIELLFFAYRNFTADADEMLARDGFGRAHHRVLHFVNRQPGLTIADLLSILGITKQSLARVLRQLIDRGLIRQISGKDDRRQRHLHLTPAGEEMAKALLILQSSRIKTALEGLDETEKKSVTRFFLAMLDVQSLSEFQKMNAKP